MFKLETFKCELFEYIVYSLMYATQWLQRLNYALDHHDLCIKGWIKYFADNQIDDHCTNCVFICLYALNRQQLSRLLYMPLDPHLPRSSCSTCCLYKNQAILFFFPFLLSSISVKMMIGLAVKHLQETLRFRRFIWFSIYLSIKIPLSIKHLILTYSQSLTKVIERNIKIDDTNRHNMNI